MPEVEVTQAESSNGLQFWHLPRENVRLPADPLPAAYSPNTNNGMIAYSLSVARLSPLACTAQQAVHLRFAIEPVDRGF